MRIGKLVNSSVNPFDEPLENESFLMNRSESDEPLGIR